MSRHTRTRTNTPQITNRRARFDYTLGDELTVGMVLTGREVRAARDGHVQLKGAFVTIRDHGLWLNNASLSLRLNERGKPGARSISTEPIKLLARRSQINQLAASKQQGSTIVPLRMIVTGRYLKLVIATGTGKKQHDKRETLKRRQAERESHRAMRQWR